MKYAIAIITIVIFLAGCGAAKVTQKTTPTSTTTPTITLEKYDLVQNGMTYVQVSTIMGSTGVKMGESTGANPANDYVEYTWTQGNNGANGTFDFVGDKLIGKAQFGLR